MDEDKLTKVLWIEGYSPCLELPKEVWQAFLDNEIELWNAARPLYGNAVHKGRFVRGVFYAVVEPGDEFAEGWRERNRSLDAQMVEFVSTEQIEGYRSEMAAEYGDHVLDADYDEIVMSYVNHRRHEG